LVQVQLTEDARKNIRAIISNQSFPINNILFEQIELRNAFKITENDLGTYDTVIIVVTPTDILDKYKMALYGELLSLVKQKG
jgi:hypothetical protein